MYNMGVVVEELGQVAGHISLTYIKTVCNAWTTSRRLHLIVRSKCVFGCEDEDELQHYLCCPHLSHAVACALRKPLPVYYPSILSVFPPPPRNNHILTVFLYYSIYHVYRNTVPVAALAREENILRIGRAAAEKAKSLGLLVEA